jgi:hypothetical protein
MYLAGAEERARRKAKRDADEWERWRQNRWVTCLDAAKVDWPDMTDADREFVDRAKKLSGEPGTVSDEAYRLAKDILDRYRAFANRKQTLIGLVDRVMRKLTMKPIDPDDDEKVGLFYRLRELGRKVERITDINDPKLADYYAEVMPILRELDPPPANPFSQ